MLLPPWKFHHSDNMSTKRSSLDYPSLVSALRGHSLGTVTYNWDVAVSYDSEQINARLKAEYDKADTKLVTKVSITYHVKKGGFSGTEEWDCHLELSLGRPLISFNADTSDATCSLKMSLEGKWWNEKADGSKSAETNLDTGAYYLLLSKLGLSTVRASDKAVTQGGNVVTFPDTTTDQHIVVDFATDKATVTIGLNDTSKSLPDVLQDSKFSTALTSFFHKLGSSINYTLAIANNTTPKSKEVVLVPKAFRFVCTGDKTLSYLTLLIETKASGVQGNTSGVQSQWDGLWSGDLKTYPVPNSQSASIFFNKSFFVNHYLGAAVKASDWTGYSAVTAKALGQGQSSGFVAEFTWNTFSVSGDTEKHDITYLGGWDKYEMTVPSRVVDPNQGGQKLTMYFSQGNGNDKAPTVDISWSYKDEIYWEDVLQHHENGPPAVNSTSRTHGTIIGTWSMKKTVSLDVKLTQESLTFSFDIEKKDWSYTSKPESVSWSDVFKSLLPGGSTPSERLPSFAAAMKGNPITFTFDFGLLRFFSITNVLLPGKKVIDIDTNAGLRIPNDAMIVGHVLKDVQA